MKNKKESALDAQYISVILRQSRLLPKLSLKKQQAALSTMESIKKLTRFNNLMLENASQLSVHNQRAVIKASMAIEKIIDADLSLLNRSLSESFNKLSQQKAKNATGKKPRKDARKKAKNKE